MNKMVLIISLVALMGGCATVPVDKVYDQYTDAKKSIRDAGFKAWAENIPHAEVIKHTVDWQRAFCVITECQAEPLLMVPVNDSPVE